MATACDALKSGKPHKDTLFTTYHIDFKPGGGAGFAMLGIGKLKDNHGNYASRNELFVSVNGEVRHYHLTDQQYRNFWHNKIAEHAAAADIGFRRGDEIPLVRGITVSPLETMACELEAQGAPYTPVVPKSTKKSAHK